MGKGSASLQLPLEVLVAIETVSVLRRAFRTAHAHTFGKFDVSPFKEIGVKLACLRGISKMAAE